MPEFLGEAPSRTRRIRPLHPGQEDHARRPLQQGARGRAIASPFDEVALPVAGHRAGGPLGGPFSKRRPVGELAPSIRPPRPRSACLARLTQRGQQFAPPRSAGQHRHTHIEGLGRALVAHVVRRRVVKQSGHLLGRATVQRQLELRDNDNENCGVRPPHRRSCTLSALPREGAWSQTGK
ncbi:MAG: hypothetical protein ABI988_09640 [Nitrospirota bacterium]